MTRLTSLLLKSLPVVAIYLLFLTNVLPVPLLPAHISAQLLPVIPWVFLVAFGAYALASLGWGLITFRDCPEAHYELLAQIDEAKADLRAKGVSVDS